MSEIFYITHQSAFENQIRNSEHLHGREQVRKWILEYLEKTK